MVSEEVSFDFLHGVWRTAAEVGPDDVDDVGPFVEGGVDGAGGFGRSLRTLVELGDDEAVGRVVVLLVSCVDGWL